MEKARAVSVRGAVNAIPCAQMLTFFITLLAGLFIVGLALWSATLLAACAIWLALALKGE